MERRRVLVVDDNEDVARAMAEVLIVAGYEVFVAVDGQEALAISAKEQPDAILLDLRMSGLSGFEVCRSVRAEPWGKGVLIIAVTGLSRQADRDEARAAGCDHYLLKPASSETVVRLLRGEDRRGR